MKEMDKYRFDDAYETVYEYVNGAYISIGSYYAFNIKRQMSEKTKIKKVEKELNNR